MPRLQPDPAETNFGLAGTTSNGINQRRLSGLPKRFRMSDMSAHPGVGLVGRSGKHPTTCETGLAAIQRRRRQRWLPTQVRSLLRRTIDVRYFRKLPAAYLQT